VPTLSQREAYKRNPILKLLLGHETGFPLYSQQPYKDKDVQEALMIGDDEAVVRNLELFGFDTVTLNPRKILNSVRIVVAPKYS